MVRMGADGTARRVLIVEDVADLRDFYAILLREEGYEVACACDGSDALRWLSWDPDVILLDLMMPIMDGYEFLPFDFVQLLHRVATATTHSVSAS